MQPWWSAADQELTSAQFEAGFKRNPATTWRFIGSEDDVDFGYFQYWREPDRAGVDQFLADPGTLYQGLGPRALTAFIEHIASFGVPDKISVDPHPENKAAIRCYEKCGFVHNPDKSSDLAYYMERPMQVE